MRIYYTPNNSENYIWGSYTEACTLSGVSTLRFMYIYTLYASYVSSLRIPLLLLVANVR